MESLIEKLEELDAKQQAKREELESARQDDRFASELADLLIKIEAQAIITDSASGRLVDGVGDGREFDMVPFEA